MGRPAASLIQALLNRNPVQRLGAGGGAEVQNHAFFNKLDWDALYRREMPPPFSPCKNQDTVNTENFEKEFTNMAVYSVDAADRTEAEAAKDETFLNFTFEEESFLDSVREERFSQSGRK